MAKSLRKQLAAGKPKTTKSRKRKSKPSSKPRSPNPALVAADWDPVRMRHQQNAPCELDPNGNATALSESLIGAK